MQKLSEISRWYSGQLAIKPSCLRIKNHLLKKYGPMCWECGWSGKNPFSNRWIVELDHIDGDHTNFKPSNFRLLCPNCHAMTPTYKGLNTSRLKNSRGAYIVLSDID